MNDRATLKKISETLNLSISTVSRALKNHPDIAERTKKRVRDLAASMEYEPNTYAISLRTNSSKVFGLIVPAISNFFYESFIAAIEKKARENGFSLMILQSGEDPATEAENLKLCRSNRVAGIFISIVPGSQPDVFAKFEAAEIPLIFFDKVPEADNYNKVCLADEDAAIVAANTIIKHGKKKVLALFGNPEFSITRKREAAFSKALERELSGSAILIKYCNNSEEATKVTEEMAALGSMDTVFAMSDEILIGVMRGLYKLNIAIPSEISVLAISNGFLPGLYNPQITYIETNGYALGELAMQRMMDYLAGQTFSRSVILPSRLVEGVSM